MVKVISSYNIIYNATFETESRNLDLHGHKVYCKFELFKALNKVLFELFKLQHLPKIGP